MKQSETGRNTRLLSIAEESDENIVSVRSIASPTVSHAHTDVVSEEATDNSEIKERDSAPCESVKSAVTIIPPVANSYVVSTSPVPMLNQLPPITQYSDEEQPDGETFQDWFEQFESVAQLGGWSSHAKASQLVNQVTRISLLFL